MTQPPSPRSTTSLGSTPRIQLEEEEELPFPSTETAEQETNTEKIMVQDRGCDPIQIPTEIPPVIQKTLDSITSRLDQLTGLVLDKATVIHSMLAITKKMEYTPTDVVPAYEPTPIPKEPSTSETTVKDSKSKENPKKDGKQSETDKKRRKNRDTKEKEDDKNKKQRRD